MVGNRASSVTTNARILTSVRPHENLTELTEISELRATLRDIRRLSDDGHPIDMTSSDT
ncbi:MAG: hypothetical protein ACKVVP_08480 [Chloroflexota bacterium]